MAIFLIDGEWEVMIGNASPFVYLGESEPRIRARHKSLRKAIQEALASLEMERKVVAAFDKHRDILQPIVDRANDALKGRGKW